MNILWIGLNDKSEFILNDPSNEFLYLLELFFYNNNYNFHVFGDDAFTNCFKHAIIDIKLDHLLSIKWDIILIKNAFCFLKFKLLISKLHKYPIIFTSLSNDLCGYIPFHPNIFSAISLCENKYNNAFIPSDIIFHTDLPLLKCKHREYKKNDLNNLTILYIPTSNSITISDEKLFEFVNQRNINLIIANERYCILKENLSEKIKIVPFEKYFYYMSRTDLVIATQYYAIQAIYLARPCIIMGEYGFGGFVTLENYSFFKTNYFKGRPGAHFNEYVSFEILDNEIRNVFSFNHNKMLNKLKNIVYSDYCFDNFCARISSLLEKNIQLNFLLKNTTRMLVLKPILSDCFNFINVEEKIIVYRNNIIIGKIDKPLFLILKNMDGSIMIGEIIKNNYLKSNEQKQLFDLIKYFWMEKLIYFV